MLDKDFAAFAERVTARVRAPAEAVAAGRPVEYLPSPKISKEERALQIAARDGITRGLICVLSGVELGWGLKVRGDRATKRLRVVPGERPCTQLYCYFLDPDLGLRQVRLQTWLPLTIQGCVHGHAWLAHRRASADLATTVTGNAITAVADWTAAQRVSDGFASWPGQRTLDQLAQLVNPWLTGAGALFGGITGAFARAKARPTSCLPTRPICSACLRA